MWVSKCKSSPETGCREPEPALRGVAVCMWVSACVSVSIAFLAFLLGVILVFSDSIIFSILFSVSSPKTL